MSGPYPFYYAIDPGTRSIGLALMSRDPDVREAEGAWLIQARVKGAAWMRRTEDICEQVQHIVLSRTHEVDAVYLEMPQFFDTAGGSAVAKRGDLIKLSIAAGMIASTVAYVCGQAPIYEVPVNKWKGQLPKKTVNKRILAVMGEEACLQFEEDAWDAVGIALYQKGLL